MQIPANSALIAAQSLASAQAVQPPRPSSAPRRIDAFDLADLASKPPAAVTPARAAPVPDVQRDLIASAIDAATRGESSPQRAEQRLIRPGSTLDIKV